MSLLNITCKKATYLLSKKEEKKLSFLQKIQLRGHLMMCILCRRFEIQTGLIARLARHAHTQTTLSAEAKEKMQSVLKD